MEHDKIYPEVLKELEAISEMLQNSWRMGGSPELGKYFKKEKRG